MRQRLHSYLAKVARKLLLTRTVEAFALGAIGGGIVAACIMVAWLLAGLHPGWATVCAAAALVVVIPVTPASWRRKLGAVGRAAQRWQVPYPVCACIALTAALAAVAACVLIYTGGHARIDHAWIALAVMGAGGLTAAMTVLGRGITHHEAALYIDLRADLGERMITALELAPVADDDFAATVCEHAMAAATQHNPHRLGFWRRGRRTAGAVALTIAAALLLAIASPLDATQRNQAIAAEKARLQAADQMAEQAKTLAEAARDTASRQLAEQSDRLSKLSDRMRWGDVTPEQVMSELSRLQDENEAAQAKQDALDSVIKRLRAAEATESLTASPEQAATESPETRADAFADQMAGQMQSEAMSGDDAGKLSEALNDAANAGEGDPQLSAALRRAAEMVDQRNAEGFREAMAQAGQAMGDTQREAGASQARQEASNAIQQAKQQLARASGGGRSMTDEDFRQAANQAMGQGGNGQQGGSQGGNGQQGGSQGGNGQQDGSQDGNGQQGGPQGGNGRQGGSQGGNGQPGGGGSQGGSSVAGGGSTNRGNGSGPGGRYEGSAHNRGRWKQIYAPKPIEHAGETVRVAGTPNPDAGDPIDRAQFRAAGTQGESYVEFEKAWQARRSTAEDAVSRQKIPARYRRLIRDYYGEGE